MYRQQQQRGTGDQLLDGHCSTAWVQQQQQQQQRRHQVPTCTESLLHSSSSSSNISSISSSSMLESAVQAVADTGCAWGKFYVADAIDTIQNLPHAHPVSATAC